MAAWTVLVALTVLAAPVLAADIVDPEDCTEFPCLIFEDNFDYLDTLVWDHEINSIGGGNEEFQVYVNNRSVSYTRDGLLFIKPDVTANWKGEEFLTTGDLDLWGMNGIGDTCTGHRDDGCRRQGTPVDLIKPVISARMRTQNNFSFKYGRMEFRAKMPNADWMWPAVWMMPDRFAYGLWPASGEIDIMETRGNADFAHLNNTLATCALHAGPYGGLDQGLGGQYAAPPGSSLVDDFNVWVMDWTDEYLSISVNDVEIMYADPVTNFFDNGNFVNVNSDNPWSEGEKMAPFDQKFYIILNVAVGGVGYFPDGIIDSKPWDNDSPTRELDFWNARDSWYPTWTKELEGATSEDAAMQIDYIRVYKMTSAEM